MQQFPVILKSFTTGNRRIELFVPDPHALGNSNQKENTASLYWAKVWPAAIGLCNFLARHLSYITNKKVLEIAAGPGLPGIFAAEYAKQVFISDVEPAAISLIQQSINYHQLKNADCTVIDWNDLATVTIPQTVLLSDINYEPAQFEQLLASIHYLLNKNCTIVLSTPQRLMAKTFINQLLSYCKEQEEEIVELDGTITTISVFVFAIAG